MSVLKIKNENNEWVEITTIQGPQGPAGNDYVLTEADKQEIASMVDIPADDINYDNTKSQVEATTVQDVIDYLFETTIDAVYVENLGYQTETQVNALIASALGEIGVAEEGAY